MGEREFGTKLYYQLSLDGLVPQDHLLRRIARAVSTFQLTSLNDVVPLLRPNLEVSCLRPCP